MTISSIIDILQGPPEAAARRLLGCHVIRTTDGGQRLVGRIVETEAYDQSDAASHSYRGQTPRTKVMFGPAGHLYVYFTYGMHYCCNIVTGAVGHGSAVLLRAIEPIEGGEAMLANRQGRSSSRYTQLSTSSTDLTNGPAKLCQALLIDAHYNGHDLRREPLILQANPEIPEQEIVQTTRVGISQATDVPWRFYVRGNPYVSRQ